MGTLNSWDVTDANNNAAPPDGWPENTMAYSDVNDTGRAVQGTIKRFFADNNGSLVGGGVANAYTVTLNESGYAAYFVGLIFSCSIPAANTVAVPTMNVNGIGAVTITDNVGAALPIGALATGGIYSFTYDGTGLRVSGGIGASAGGANTNLQYNNGGLLAGMSEFTFDGDQLDIAYTGTDFAIKIDPSGNTARAIDISITDVNGNVDICRIVNEVGSTTFNTGSSLLQLRNDEPLAEGACLHVVQDGNDPAGIGQHAITVEANSPFGFAGQAAVLLNQSGDGGVIRSLDTSLGDQTPANYFAGTDVGRTEPVVQIEADTTGTIALDLLAGYMTISDGDISFVERADHMQTPGAGIGIMWLRDDTPNTLMFTDSGDNDNPISWTYAIKTADESVNNSTTLQADDELAITLEANSTYELEMNLVITVDVNSADFAGRFTQPAFDWLAGFTGETVQYSAAAVVQNRCGFDPLQVSLSTIGVSSGEYTFLNLRGTLKTVTGGALGFEWAMAVAQSGTVGLTVEAGSFLKVRKLL